MSAENGKVRSRFILVAVVLLVCVGIAILDIYYWTSSGEQEIQNNLTVLDQHFSQPKSSLLNDSPDDILLPLQVGGFQRGDISDCGVKGETNGKCHSTVYTDVNQFNGFIYVTIKSISNEKSDLLQDLSKQRAHCSPENRGENKLRSTSQYPYIYEICYLNLILTTGSLTGVTWVNGNWLVTINGLIGGKPDTMIQFARQFPN